MPRTRTYTDLGYIEVQWSKKGQLVCLISAETMPKPENDEYPWPSYRETMHQFTERGDMGVLMRDLTRARKQAFAADYRYPVTDAEGNVVAYDRYPPEHYASIPVLDPDHIVLDAIVGKASAGQVEYLP